jgi:hypothetical protein
MPVKISFKQMPLTKFHRKIVIKNVIKKCHQKMPSKMPSIIAIKNAI